MPGDAHLQDPRHSAYDLPVRVTEADAELCKSLVPP